ncbi:olfactory receptor 5D18-like [Spea bombifrons]|uniref:olfactory receptor 5D18-like n=1 Tax=Spea bombifrons TaxID=233779 RepID=UPI0023498174|nr:olfactory receptor 5D18-like [Spea bombifrons]
MDAKNITSFVEFIIVGFSDFPDLQVPIFLFFGLSYTITLIANLFLTTLIYLSPTLKTPMYFLLSNLSILDVAFTSVTSPKLLYGYLAADNKISSIECVTQFCFLGMFVTTEYLLLTIMSYDRYVAVCRPLHYSVILSEKFCTTTAIAVWLSGLIATVPVAVIASYNIYCKSNVINHLFCDISTLLELTCSDTTVIRIILLIEGAFSLLTCFLLTVTSYIYIISSVLNISSSKGKHKAFSTCASHLTTVSLFYLAILVLYFIPKAVTTRKQRKVMTALYTNVIPMLNPLVYSLRNKDVKEAFVKIIRRKGLKCFWK